MLRPFGDAAKSAFWNALDLPMNLDPMSLSTCENILHATEALPIVLLSQRKYNLVLRVAEELCLDAITALRLSSNGSVGAVAVRHSYLPSTDSSFWYGNFGPTQPAREAGVGASCTPDGILSRRQLDRCRAALGHITRLRAAKKFGQLELAFRRFNQSYVRDSISDAVVDLVVALEGSVLFGHNNEMTYRVRLRALRVLAPNRLAHDDVLRCIYGIRSEIVHSGVSVHDALASFFKKRSTAAPWTDEKAFLLAARSAVREVLWAYLQRYAVDPNLGSINTAIDSEIIARVSTNDPPKHIAGPRPPTAYDAPV